MSVSPNPKGVVMRTPSKPLLLPGGGYRRLKSFQIARLVYDLTCRFVELYVDPASRTCDQMTQAARSGVQNIAEGSVDGQKWRIDYTASRDVDQSALDALDKAGSKFGIKAKNRYSAEIETVEDLSKLISKYNNLARRAKKKKIAQVQKGNIIFVGQTMAQMDPKLFRKLRCDGYSRAMNSFRRDIQSRVNAGLPVGWCVFLGLVNEKQKTLQLAGAHMRLIIGYNAADDTIVADERVEPAACGVIYK